MFDPNNEPNYSPGMDSYGSPNQGYDSPNQGTQMPPIDIKKYLPMIVGIGVLLIVGYFLLTWLGSQKEITIALVDSDGKPVAGTLKLTGSDGKIIPTPKGTATKFKVTLFPGDYSARVIAEKYNSQDSAEITITNETESGSTEEIVMLRNLNATLTVIVETTKIYENQEIEGKILVFNSGNEFNLADVVPKTTAPIEVTPHQTGQPTLTTGGTATIDFTIKVKTGTNLTKAVPSSITFNIRGSEITSQKFEITAMPTISPTEVSVTGLSQTMVSLTAGVQKELNIKIKNNNKLIPLENLLVEIYPDSGSEDTLSWFTISDSESPSETTIPLIEPTKDYPIKIFINAPITSSLNDEFKGTIRISSSSLKDEKKSAISYKVGTASKLSLIFKINPETFPITCSKTTTVCTGMKTLATGEAYFQNTGNIDIGPIALSVNMEAQATTASCLSFLRLNTTSIPGVKAGEKFENISIDIMNPPESPDTLTGEVCVLHWEYNNPLDPSLRVSGEQQVKITKKTS
jgi:hypothetical protein